MQSLFHGIYSGTRVLLTGHTGFKGSWMSAWLTALGARVSGFSIDLPGEPSHFALLRDQAVLGTLVDGRGDIGDFDAVAQAVAAAKPEIVFHFAAQPLVRLSYADPLGTYRTNVLGSLNVLEACRRAGGVGAVVAITTDKCYENKEWPWGYRENDRLGGHDPYSSSKACCEILAASFRRSYPEAPPVATCRAGNVIGGGDWALSRLIPDMVRAAVDGRQTPIRMPDATRPWQHVLEPLATYLLLGQRLLEGETDLANAWNIGPGPEGNLSVGTVSRIVSDCWSRIQTVFAPGSDFHEASNLMLDCSKAKRFLHWEPVWEIREGIARTIEWYRAYYEEGRTTTLEQLDAFVEQARSLQRVWTCP